MSQLSHSVGVVPLVMLEVGGVKKMKREHRGVFNSPGPAGAADCSYVQYNLFAVM